LALAQPHDKEVLPHATLSEILRSIPPEASQPSTKLAVAELALTLALVGVRCVWRASLTISIRV
jgi:hypothetical protein